MTAGGLPHANRLPGGQPNRREQQLVIPDAVHSFAAGEFVLVMSDIATQKSTCDLMVLGETVTPMQMAFLIRHSTGIVHVVADKPRLERFGLYPAAWSSADQGAAGFYVATDYLPTTTTGVSARDRHETVRAFCRDTSKAEDFSKPGHMFPLCPRPGGVLEPGSGPAEAAHDLCRLADRQTVAAVGALLREDGETMGPAECLAFGKQHGIPVVPAEELHRWVREHGIAPLPAAAAAAVPEVPPTSSPRLRPPKLKEKNWYKLLAAEMTNECRECSLDTADLEVPAQASEPTGDPEFRRQVTATEVEDWSSEFNACSTCTIPVRGFNSDHGMRLQMFHIADPVPIEVVACVKGEVEGKSDVPVRIHSECFTGDVLRSAKCDCGLQLEKFFGIMEQETCAALLYIRGHEGRGIGLTAKMDAYRLQTEEHLDTVDSNTRLGFDPDLRSYDGIAGVIRSLGVKSVRLFTNNPEKIEAVSKVLPVRREACQTKPLWANKDYLRTKEDRMEHLSTMEERPESIEWPRFGDYAGFHVVVVATAWNQECTSPLVEGCEAVLLAAKCTVSVVEVPGALDLVAGCRAAVSKESPPQAVVALGTYVRGDTDSSWVHYEATVRALQELNVAGPVPVISGVAYCNTQEDAVKKVSPDLGGDWARSALQMLSVCAR